MPDDDQERILKNVEFALKCLDLLMLSATRDRIERLFDLARGDGLTYWEAANEIRIILETVEDGIKTLTFRFIPPRRAMLKLMVEYHWRGALAAFPSAKGDIVSAVDCHVYDQHTACVFHLMRVAEHGLRALAGERKIALPKGRPLEWANWRDLIREIGKEAGKIADLPPSAGREEALEFYRGALGEFEAFKDAYRNSVMHTRKSYDEHAAMSVMTHVREFMQRLSAKLDERGRAIRWRTK